MTQLDVLAQRRRAWLRMMRDRERTRARGRLIRLLTRGW